MAGAATALTYVIVTLASRSEEECFQQPTSSFSSSFGDLLPKGTKAKVLEQASSLASSLASALMAGDAAPKASKTGLEFITVTTGS